MSTEKDGLETGAINEFSLAYALLCGENKLVFQELRNPPEPDGLCTLDGLQLHIEVGHIYGTVGDAKRLLGRNGKSAATNMEIQASTTTQLDLRLLAPLNELLADNTTKTYSTSRVWLLIRSAFPLWNINDFEEHQTEIAVPLVHPFEQIWLLCGSSASDGLLRLA